MIDPKVMTLLALAENCSYTKTAKKMALTQPAVTHQIKLLEEDYKIKLFRRHKKKLVLTPEGEVLVKYARRMSALNDNCRQAIEDTRMSVHSLNIGMTPTAEETIVPHVVARYCNMHNDIHFNVTTDAINNIYDKLKNYELDLAIVEGNLFNPKFTSVLLDTDYLCVAVSKEHSIAKSKRKSISLQELKKENFILRSRSAGTRQLFENQLVSHYEHIKNFNIILELDNVTTIKELVASNFGITIIAHSACTREIAKGTLVTLQIENMNLTREINMVYHKDFKHLDMLDDLKNLYESK